MPQTREEDDYKDRVNSANCVPGEESQQNNTRCAPCLRVSNERYAKDATFEQRLSIEDKQFLHEMGIGL
jgi:hypothetical protein